MKSSSSPSSITLTAQISQSLPHSIRPYHPLLPAGLPNYILCPHRAEVNKFLLVGQPLQVHILGSIEERLLSFRSCLSSSVSHVLFVLVGWFLRWEVSGRVGVHRRTSLMSSSLLLLPSSTCLVRLGPFLRWEVSDPTSVVSWSVMQFPYKITLDVVTCR